MYRGIDRIRDFIKKNPDVINIEKKVFISDDKTIEIGYYELFVDINNAPSDNALSNCTVRVYEDGTVTLINAWLFHDIGEDEDLYKLVDKIYKKVKRVN